VFNYLLRFPALSIVRQGGGDLRYYVYLPSGVLLYSIEAAGNTRHFFHFDEMGNTVMLTGDSGAMTDSYAITPYGENADHVGTTSNPFTWQGKYGVMQEGQGLYYARSRHYDASAARFVSRDPVTTGDPRSSEPYIYARGNPLKYVDPLGNLSTDDLQDAQSFLAALALTAALTGLPVDVNDAQALLLSAINTPACSDSCAYEGWELVDFIGNNNDLNFNDLYALLTPPAPAPPPDPPAPTFVIGSSPMPVQLGLPVAAQPTLPCVGAGSGGAAGSPTGLAPLPLPSLLASVPQLTFDAWGHLITQDGGSVVSNDGGSLITQDGGSLVARGGDTVLVNGLAYVVSNDGGSLISQDGGNIITVSPAGIISDDSEGLLGGISNLYQNGSSFGGIGSNNFTGNN
jgi:RHS repeat-associated protein